MPPSAQPSNQPPLEGEALVKEVCRRIRLARSFWDAHNNAACRQERERALLLYSQLSPEQKQQIPQVLRVWLRYRSEKYLGAPHCARQLRAIAGGQKAARTATIGPR